MKKILSFSVFACMFGLANAQYVIDSTFHSNGTNEFVEFAGNIVNGQRIAYTANDDIIVAGRWNNELTVWKYTQAGILDNTFGMPNGFGVYGVSNLVLPTSDYTDVKDVEVQADGKIVVLAEALLDANNLDYSQAWIVLARFLPNGTPDSTFNGTGLVFTKLAAGYEYQSRTMSIDENNQIYVGGLSSEYGSFSCGLGEGKWFIANFQENGALDNTFNTTGYILGNSYDLAQPMQTTVPFAKVLDLKALPNGKLLAAGILHSFDSCYFSARFNSDGSYDNTYDLNGRSINHIQDHLIPSNDLSYAKILSDESILYHAQYTMPMGGLASDSMDFYIHKVNSLGAIETSFGTNGMVVFHERATRIPVTTDNQDRIVYSWYNTVPDNKQRVHFRRLLPNGTPDMTFSAAGFYRHEPLLNDPYLNASFMNDVLFNASNSELTLLSFRSASYAPNSTFRLLNYFIDPAYSNLGLADQSSDFLNLYPNPTSGELFVETTTDAAYVIYTIAGEEVTGGRLISGTTAITLPVALSEGVYFVKVITEDQQVSTSKIIYRK